MMAIDDDNDDGYDHGYSDDDDGLTMAI